MHLDVQDLRNFYYRSALGRAAQRAVRDQVKRYWPTGKGHTMVGYGFAVPLLRPYLPDARRVIGLMPGPQGVLPWPQGQPNVTVLSISQNDNVRFCQVGRRRGDGAVEPQRGDRRRIPTRGARQGHGRVRCRSRHRALGRAAGRRLSPQSAGPWSS